MEELSEQTVYVRRSFVKCPHCAYGYDRDGGTICCAGATVDVLMREQGMTRTQAQEQIRDATFPFQIAPKCEHCTFPIYVGDTFVGGLAYMHYANRTALCPIQTQKDSVTLATLNGLIQPVAA